LGRLENIIARNNKRPGEKIVVSLALGGILLVLILLAIFTDLGKPPVPVRPPGSAQGSGAPGAGSAAPVGPAQHVHGVLLRAPAHSKTAPAAPQK
jgi:hypothetical protein